MGVKVWEGQELVTPLPLGLPYRARASRNALPYNSKVKVTASKIIIMYYI